MEDRFVIVTRYVRPKDKRIVRHVYAGPEGTGWSTRQRALTQVRHQIADSKLHHGDREVQRLLDKGVLEINAVKVIAL